MRVHLVVNPGAGDGMDGPAVVRLVEDAGHEVVGTGAADPGWERSLAREVELVAAAGGDGTISAVLLAVAGRGLPVGIVPLGTANNIAGDLGLPTGDPAGAVASWRSAATRPFGLPVVDGAPGPRFVESVGLGLFAELIAEADAADPDEGVDEARERLARLVERAPEFDVRLAVDGRERRDRVIGLEVLNIASVGPRVVLDRSTRSDDGRVTVVPIRAGDREALAAWLRSPGPHAAAVPSVEPGVRAVVVEADAPVHVDDEVVDADRVLGVTTAALVSVEVLSPSSSPTTG
ncbi:diacylglycerol/lipid kinase family protein [Dermatobacter hominis]|uniref:diacylglycerol/lipid kinase family protein n=1 Tax=Dermatobacter hominis TaxID=2884263 RepID=UPI001D126C40|nr:diacylglycerol kinase family protein [Dermatobacter hominis]UDY35173.1 hypothetical protein LH044_17760 [Dermatobacter hominis]